MKTSQVGGCRQLASLWVGLGVSIVAAIPTMHWFFYAKLQSSRVVLKALYPLPLFLAMVTDMNVREWLLFALVLSQFLVYGVIIALGKTRVIQVRIALILLALHLVGASALVYHECLPP